ncbi:MAG TPA: DedA family protein [Candidatus Nanoarchaeia archaeon]|nr:DedA family protein [Candidatus Nanoarchaeia archaeon]
MIWQFFEVILHLDKYLQTLVNEYSTITYAILFLIIFLETGLVIAPFLPGDSLLFVAGALAAVGSFRIEVLLMVIFIAAVLGDTLNYHVGKIIGPKIFKKESSLFFRKDYLLRAQEFYVKYGKKTIVLARFIPIIRTFAPFVAGIGTMPYRIFLTYNVLGAVLWSSFFLFGGFLFGNIVWVKEHFGLMVIIIILISLVPLVKEMVAHFWRKKKSEHEQKIEN